MEDQKSPLVPALLTLALPSAISLLVFMIGGKNFFSAPRQTNSSKQVRDIANNESPLSGIRAPDFSKFPKGPKGESIIRGKEYLEDTYRKLPEYSGAKMNCTSCHLNSGTTANAGPWVGIVTQFPQYRSRSGKMDTLQDRVNDCFERSLNGKRLPLDSQPLTDIISYMTWLSEGYQVGQKIDGSGMPKLQLARAPDLKHGESVYINKCMSCHQTNGEGLHADGKPIYPPLWGKQSYNIGAGMARLHTAAGFVKANMPLGQGGSLTDDEAWDVAAYFSTKERPDFSKKSKDWPKGEKPKDARY